jgi:hypothetical protein
VTANGRQLYCSQPIRQLFHPSSLRLHPCAGSVVCRLCGIGHSGTKWAMATRILDTVAVRLELATWGELRHDTHESAAAHELALFIEQRYKKPQLKALARRCGTFESTTKRGLIIGLLQWRAEKRRRGQEFDAERKEKG